MTARHPFPAAEAKRRHVQKARTRARIIAAAAELFAARGFAAMTFRDLAAAIGMSTGEIFAHFKDKAALYEAATGLKAPDVAAFLARVAGVGAHDATAVAILSAEAGVLRRQLVGEGPHG